MHESLVPRHLEVVVGMVLVAAGAAHAEGTDPLSSVPCLLGGQVTLIGQRLEPFSSPYAGKNSLESDGAGGMTSTYGVYFGTRLSSSLQAYADVEMARGSALSGATGLGGLTNGDELRQGSVDLGKGPYVARLYARYWIPLSSETEHKSRAQDQLAGAEPTTRIEFKLGKFAATDDFDVNRYANNTRTQFLNWGFINDTAWDYAADTRGYTRGFTLAYVSPAWALRYGAFQMPTFANGNVFDPALSQARGDNVELDLEPGTRDTVIRLLAYQNHARMGVYREAIALAEASGTVPDIAADGQAGRRKYGFGLSLEQPLADAGETGLFMRLGWNDGKTESFAFTEVDRHLSIGAQLSGTHWSRPEDRIGVGLLSHLLSADHRSYLAAGGNGFVLGDGRLSYGHEQILEAYYLAQLGRYVQLTPDVQFIDNPGYNRDRGPAAVFSLRLRVSI